MHQMRRGQMSHQSSHNARALRTAIGSALIAAAAFAAVPARADVTECLKSYQLGRKDEAIRLCRRAAWQDNDLFAQAKLGDIYAAKSKSDTNYEDKVEAAVWYYHAVINLRQSENFFSEKARQTVEKIVSDSRQGFDDIYKGLLQDERMDVRNRVIYIQSCRGPEGFLLLGQLHDPNFDRHTIYPPGGGGGGGYGASIEYIQTPLRRGGGTPIVNYSSGYASPYSGGSSSQPTSIVLDNKPFEKSEIEAQLYYRLADPDVFPIVKDYLNDPAIRPPGAGQNGTEPRSKADRWLSPFEYYASETRQRGELRSGTVLSDECPTNMAKERALALGKQMIPDPFIRDMLALLKFRADGRSDYSRAIAKFQDMLGEPQTGELTPAQRVRLIQILAVQGHARAQRCLGIMYMKGIGVLKNLVRAEKWLRAADEQGDGEAAYALSELYTTGGSGIEKNEDMATRYRQRAAADGFTPVRDEFLRLFRAIP